MATEVPVADISSTQALNAIRGALHKVTATYDEGSESASFAIDEENGFRQKAALTGSSAIAITVPDFTNNHNIVFLLLDVSAYTGTLTFSGVDVWGHEGGATPRYSGRSEVPLLFIWDDDASEIIGFDLGHQSNSTRSGKYASPSSSSGALTINLANGAFHETTLTENITSVSITGLIPSEVNWFQLRVAQDGTGGRTWTNPSSWKFPAGVDAYAPTSDASAYDIVEGVSYDGGTNWIITYALDIGG